MKERMNRTGYSLWVLAGSAILLLLVSTSSFTFRKPETAPPVFAGNFHMSMYYRDNADFFPAFAKIKPLAPPPHVFIVNQHILAAHLIAKQFALSADPKVETVVLITQNNWNAGRAPIITSSFGWKTPLGVIEPATAIADSLVSKRLAVIDEDIFEDEHGITGVVPYVAHSFPNAAIVPIVIRDKTPDNLVDALAEELSKLDLSTTAIVGTIDMSHYLPKYVADVHDRLTLQTIRQFDYETLPRLDIDTAPALRAIMKVAERAEEKRFIQTGGINSAEIVGEPELQETTSYITGYFARGGNARASSTVHMLFVGDIMLDRNVATKAKRSGADSLFAKVERLFLGAHALVGNLEGTMTDNPSISQKNFSILRFTFNPAFAGLLRSLRFTALSLANNHALDFGRDGFEQTKSNLGEAGILSFGSPQNDTALSTRATLQGKTVCFVGYHDLFTPNPAPAIREMQDIRDGCSYVVLFAHWGVEYSEAPSERQRKLAREFIDGGADLVIGAHPHVVEPVEVYSNKAIFYSLGNFMFDQNFSFAVKHGLAVHVEWSDEKTRFTLVPVTVEHEAVGISLPEERVKTLFALTAGELPKEIASSIIDAKEFILESSHNLIAQ